MGCGSSSEQNASKDDMKNAEKGEGALSNYLIGKKLGEGHFAQVKKCRRLSDGKDYAIKIIDKQELQRSHVDVTDEIAILRKVGSHPYVLHFIDHFEDDNNVYLVTELVYGGDLFNAIVEEEHFSEKRAAKYMKEIAQAISYIHSCGVTHRDLKPENILLTVPTLSDADIKICDFGLSKVLEGHASMMKTVCGTWCYCAPEVIEHKEYTEKVDVWTIGVLMFVMLAGYHPFDVYGNASEPELFRRIKRVQFDFDDEVWEGISDDAKNLIVKLLKHDAEDRMTLDAFLQDQWIIGHESMEDKKNDIMIQNFQKFHNQRHEFRGKLRAVFAANRLLHTPERKDRELKSVESRAILADEIKAENKSTDA